MKKNLKAKVSTTLEAAVKNYPSLNLYEVHLLDLISELVEQLEAAIKALESISPLYPENGDEVYTEDKEIANNALKKLGIR